MSAPSQPTDVQPSDAPPVYGSPPSGFEAPKNMDGQPEGGPHVMARTDQNTDNDGFAEALVREFEAYDFGNDAEFRVSGGVEVVNCRLGDTASAPGWLGVGAGAGILGPASWGLRRTALFYPRESVFAHVPHRPSTTT